MFRLRGFFADQRRHWERLRSEGLHEGGLGTECRAGRELRLGLGINVHLSGNCGCTLNNLGEARA